ncbi:Fc receptor-like A [Erpetoichthys calabaricus]|uniref:Fc receptor-like A n=1 Tax=Erpetoichthys calabaricus TaxID=27687 RepID=UPI002234C3F7|nr:Fc receptor-like A [Erpetoichthys calabaricus]
MQTFEFCLLICLIAVMPSVHNAEKPKVKISSGEKPVYVGDTVTVECSHESDRSDSTGWRYWWYRNGGHPSQGQKTEKVTVDQPGSITYQCGVKNDHYTSPYSDHVTLTVLELPSQPILRVLPSTSVWKGDTVTLRCLSKSGLTGTKVTYTFQKGQKSEIKKTPQNEHKINLAKQNHTGSYWCEVEEGKKKDKKKSDEVQLTVKGK